jgi:hypothetical protein
MDGTVQVFLPPQKKLKKRDIRIFKAIFLGIPIYIYFPSLFFSMEISGTVPKL